MSAQSLVSPAIVCRPALPMDTLQVMDLSSHIWEGHDYLPFVWEAWLAEPYGLLTVAEYGGRIAGVGKLTYLSPGQWWLEGLRVHPEFEGRGVASHINDYLLDIWQQNGGGTVRLTTSSERVKVHSLAAHRGFIKTGEYSVYGAASLQEPVERFTPLQSKDIPDALDLVLHSPVFSLQNGLMDYGWRWGVPCLEGLEMAVNAGHAWWWQGRRGVLAFWEDEDERRKYLVLHMLACPVERMPECLLDYRRLAGSLGYAAVEWIVPLNPELLSVIQEAGFKQSGDEVLYLFEKKGPGFMV
jgi:hypothetical protein